MQTPYDADYFLRGKEVGVSNYQDYRWLEAETTALAQRVVEAMRIEPGECFLDFGCARGYLVKALRRLGINACGYDISTWAIENCDPDVKGYVGTALPYQAWDHVWLKDCAEHIELEELRNTICRLADLTEKSMLLIVPLSKEKDGPYLRDEDNFDKTHVIRWPLEEWIWFTDQCCDKDDWSVHGSFHIPGLKPASLSHPKSCGFITLRRV